MLTDLGTEVEVAEEDCRLWARHNQDDEDEKQKSKHVVHLMGPGQPHAHNSSTFCRLIRNYPLYK